MRKPKPTSARTEARRRAREAKNADLPQSPAPADALPQAPSPPSIQRQDILVCLALLALTIAVYWPVYRFDFLSYDDSEYVTQNVRVQAGLNVGNIGWAFRTFFFMNWHPVTWLSYMLDAQLFGLRPAGFHLVNVLFHALTTQLVFVVFKRMTAARWPSAFLAMLFAVHPLHVESVAWIAERKDVLSGFFFMLALWGYLRYVERPQITRYGLALLFFALGLMSKPMLVTFPFVLLLLDFWPLRRLLLERGSPSRCASDNTAWSDHAQSATPPQAAAAARPVPLLSLLWEKMPFFILSGISSLLTFLAQHGAQVPFTQLPVSDRLANALVSYARYLGKAIWPANLAVHYPPTRWPAAAVAGAALLVVTLTLSAVVQWRRRPYLAVGWFWFLGMLVPVIGLIQVGGQSMADRYMYLPLIGLFLMLVWSLSRPFTLSSALCPPHFFSGGQSGEKEKGQSAEDKVQKTKCSPNLNLNPNRNLTPALTLLAALSLLPFLLVSTRQVRFWDNTQHLFAHALAVTPRNSQAHEGLGVALFLDGKTNEALPHFTTALEIDPGNFAAYGSVANVLVAQGKTAEALDQIQKGLQLRPDNPILNQNGGFCLALQGKFTEALPYYAAALSAKPEFPEASFNYANALAKLRRFDEAVAQYESMLRFKPNSANAHLNLGNVLMEQGRFTTAAAHYEAVLRLEPTNSDAHAYLALSMARQGFAPQAFPHFAEAIRLEPGNPETEYQFASALYTAGKPADAAVHYREAIRLKPDFVPALNDLAWIRAASEDAKLRDGAEAVTLAERACDLTGRQQSVFLGTLAGAYAEAGQFPKAIETAQKACDLARSSGQADLAANQQRLLELYRSGKPYRDGMR